MRKLLRMGAALLSTDEEGCGLSLMNYWYQLWPNPCIQPRYGHSWSDSSHNVSELDETRVTLEPSIELIWIWEALLKLGHQA